MRPLNPVGRLTLRARLTALYGAAFFLAGGLLVAVMYGIVALQLEREPSIAYSVSGPGQFLPGQAPTTEAIDPPSDRLIQRIQTVEDQRRDATLRSLLWESLIALGVVGVSAAVLGYVVTGRALRPLTQITATARRVADRNLHERIDLDGPPDEIKELADTFDDMLARLDQSFKGQRHFVGNASHELRTPLAVERTLLEVAMADPNASGDLKAVGKTLLETNARSERLIEGLLTLARSEHEVCERQPVDLSDLVIGALGTCVDELQSKRMTVHRDLRPAPVSGDAELLEQLVLNLVQNAIRHNQPADGSVWVNTGQQGSDVAFEIQNTGPAIAHHELDRMFEPFTRLSRERVGTSQGLGLSIARSVAHAHNGSVTAKRRGGGGLIVTVRLPQPNESPTRTDEACPLF